MARLSWQEIEARALRFSRTWRDAASEKADEQPFVVALLSVFGLDEPDQVGQRQMRFQTSEGNYRYVDFFWKGHLAVEMKSKGEDLQAAYEQLRSYMELLPAADVPLLWLVCDFETLHLWNHETKEVYIFKLRDFRDHVRRFAVLANYEPPHYRAEQLALNVKAAEKMAKLHDALKDCGYDGHSLEVYMVRLLFCMFADDTHIFPRDSFYHYVKTSAENGEDLAYKLERLFDVLNTPDAERVKLAWLNEELRQFQYINGSLFAENLKLAHFDRKMRVTLLECIDFDWSTISPAIFGAMFQGVMDEKQRRSLGAHYTSEENIEKLIRPLFMDELRDEFERLKTSPGALSRFHDKLSTLSFLDPACGCGNFLIITYRELRELEHDVLLALQGTNQMQLNISDLIKVNVGQFYGIELEEFPAQIAQVGLWLMDHQMNLKAEKLFGQYFARLPLTQGAHIVCGNALRMDWEDVVPKSELSYILGNPPFVGYSNQSPEQKNDMLSVYVDETGKPLKSAGKIDYVAAWYYKAAQFIKGTSIRTAFVSTNSITQGEQVAFVWKPLLTMFGLSIDFAYRTYQWHNEARGVAAVHVVIIGFSNGWQGKKRIIDGSTEFPASNISPYLIDAPDILIEARSKPLCPVPEMIAGGKPTDSGNLILTEEEMLQLISQEPGARQYIRRYYMGDDFINNVKRYCLWLVGCPPNELRQMPLVRQRIEGVRQMRLSSTKAATRAKAETPMLFDEIRKITGDSYVAVPRVSSERRRYIPIGFLPASDVPGDMIYLVSSIDLYGFCVLISNVHIAWLKTICGRLKSAYRYSNSVVYNNYPWPEASSSQQEQIARLAQAVLDARTLYPNSSLADLYDPLTMPPELTKAHRDLDRAVMRLYGFTVGEMDEAQCVAALMQRYQDLALKT